MDRPTTDHSYWSQRTAEQATIRHLQTLLDEQVAWSKRSAEEVVIRDRIIRELQAQIAELHERRGETGSVVRLLRPLYLRACSLPLIGLALRRFR